MPAIVAVILQIVGPLLAEWLKAWLERLLKRAADQTPKGSAGDTDADRARAVLETALGMTKRRQILRRNLLRHMIAEVPPVVAAGGDKLPKSVAAELAANASSVSAEE